MREVWLLYVMLGGGLLLTAGSYVQWRHNRYKQALWLLMGAAFLVRLVMAGLDPFLHEWDERFHALVARNLMANPLLPLLRADDTLPYDYKAWCCNHVWLHKQPLFLWQMALSMKIFGVNLMALRLPSALLGSLLLWPVYRLGILIYDDADTGYLAALLVAFAYYALEQTAGFIGMDHDDVAFTVYVGASVWAYYEYRASARPLRWLIWVGVFAGAAVLCKWLTGLVVYAGWGLAIVSSATQRRQLAEYGRAFLSFAVAVVVALPWQLYTAWRFPLESRFEREYNSRHFTEALEAPLEPWYYHFRIIPVHYSLIAWLMAIALVLAVLPRTRNPKLGPLLSIIAIIYLFFTIAVTKMYSYVYVVSPLLLLLAARPLALAVHWFNAPDRRRLAGFTLPVLIIAVILADARPWGIIGVHFLDEYYGMHQVPLFREQRIANAKLYEQMGRDIPSNYSVINVPPEEQLQAMFHSGLDVYSWAPSEEEARMLLDVGHRFAAFPNNHNLVTPPHIANTPDFRVIWGVPE